MSYPEKESWGSQPLHVQVSKEQHDQDEFESDSPSHRSHPADESLCCPSLSDIFSCCVSCSHWFCCCKRCSQKTEKFSKVSYSYLQPIKAEDSIDGDLVSHEKSLPYQSVFQFPQKPQQFPAHPQLPLKPNRMELRHPQMKYTPGGGPERIVLPESPFPAPYLHNRGPGLQTPFVEMPGPGPIRQQPRASGGLEFKTAAAQRKKRISHTRVKTSEDELQSSQMDTAALGEETKSSHEELKLVEKRKLQGRNASLPIGRLSVRRRRRLFSMRSKQSSQADDDEDVPSKAELEKLQKHRFKHRARTVGGSPSQQPSVDPEKYRRCQTPEYVLDGERTLKMAAKKEKKGLAMRRCKTPDTLISSKEETSVKKKRQSDSPETEGSTNVTSSSSPGSKSGQNEEEKEAAEASTAPADSSSTKQDSLVTKIISTEGKRRWGSRREKFRRRMVEVTTTEEDERRKKLAKSRTLPAHVTSPPSYLTSGAGDTASASAITDDPPMLYFSLYFDIQRRALAVNLMKAENLPQKPASQGSCDPFVMMFLLPNKQEVLQSVIKQRTLNPVFKQVFEFSGILAHDLKNQVLVFRVFDHDRFSKNDLIGTVIVQLKDADLYGVLMRREIDQTKGLLKQFTAGDLLFSLAYSPDRQLLHGIILKATNLRKADIWGLADPYVKIYVIHENKRISKWKTEVKKNTLVPIYNESFQFDISGMDIKQVSLEIWIMDYDWFSRNDKMGVVYVGANSPQEVGRCHWLEILSSPEHQTSHWHTIIPYNDLKQARPFTKTQKQQQKLQPPPPSHQKQLHDDSDSHSFVSDTPTL